MANQRKVVSNVLKQNCYIRDCIPIEDVSSEYSDKTFKSLTETQTSKGIDINFVDVPYPITPQYVNSFVDSSDYRRDPVNAVANGVKRTNLGDVSGLQDVLGLDFVSAQKLYSALKRKFEAPKVVDDNKEVIDNG